MSNKRKLVKETGQSTLSEFEFTRSELPNRSAKQRTPPSTEKCEPKRINMTNPNPSNPSEQGAFDFAVMEKRLIASY